MKRFRNITIAVLSIIILLFLSNVFYLVRLYDSIKEQYTAMARECLVQADFIEILSSLKEQYDYPDSNLKVNIELDINHRITEAGSIIPTVRNSEDASDTQIRNNERLIGFFDSFHKTMTYNLRQEAVKARRVPNLPLLDSIFKAELNHIGLYPKNVIVVPADSTPISSTRGMWEIDYSLIKDSKPIYKAYISRPLGNMLRQASGVVVTTFLIIIMMSFAFVYFIRTVMKMRSLEEMKDDFTNNMTHELKTPIAASYTAIDTLLNCGKHNDPEKRERYLHMALEQLSYLGEKVETILSVSMNRRKTLTIHKETIELKPFLEELASIHCMHADKEVKISIDAEPVDLTIKADPNHLANTLNNLIDNAVKYSGKTVQINIRANQNTISISDNGIGIPSKCQPMIFNKFYRVPTGKRQNVRGYGIGLYYVKAIVEKMGWHINVTSSVGKGSTFTIKIGNNGK